MVPGLLLLQEEQALRAELLRRFMVNHRKNIEHQKQEADDNNEDGDGEPLPSKDGRHPLSLGDRENSKGLMKM